MFYCLQPLPSCVGRKRLLVLHLAEFAGASAAPRLIDLRRCHILREYREHQQGV